GGLGFPEKWAMIDEGPHERSRSQAGITRPLSRSPALGLKNGLPVRMTPRLIWLGPNFRVEGSWKGCYMLTLNVNGARHEVEAPDDTPLLYVLRNDLQLIGPQFGCGLAQCGACSVLVDGKEVRSCMTTAASVAGQEIVTLEGLPARWAKQKGLS